MRHVISLILVAFLLTLSSVAFGQQISDCTSQEGCVFAATSTEVTVSRKGILKGTIPVTDITHMTIDKGYLIFRQSNGVVGTHRISTEEQCFKDPAMNCRPGVVGFPGALGESAIFTCPGYLWVMETSCSQAMSSFSSAMGNSLTGNGEYGFFVVNNDNSYSLFEITSPSVSQDNVSFADLTTDSHAVYDALTDGVFMNVGTQVWVIKSDRTTQAADVLTLSESTSYAAANGAGFLLYAGITEMYIVEADMVTPTFISVSGISPGPVTAAPNAAYVVDATTILRAYDYDGNELSFSPVLDGTSVLTSIAIAPPTVPAICGNGLVEPGETCEGTDFDGEIVTCESLGFDGGVIACGASTCQPDTSGCYSCGDEVMNGEETCDGTDFGLDTCLDNGFTGGELECSASCTLILDSCYQCGDNIINPDETCDGTDVNGNICQSLGLAFDGGTLACNLDCGGYDTSSCFACGDENINTGETCDGSSLGGETCESLGFGGGTLACSGICSFDTSACTASASCGDGTLDAGEECDDGDNNSDILPNTCRTNCTNPTCGDGVLDNLEICDDGNTLAGDGCDPTCKIEIATCGNGTVDASELCDGTDLGGETCESLGFNTGVLYCNTNCSRNVSDCDIIAPPQQPNLDLYPEPDGEDFDSETASVYTGNVSDLEPMCSRTTDASGNVTISAPEGAYCDFSVELLTKSAGEQKIFYHMYPTDMTPSAILTTDGKIAFKTGGSIIAYTQSSKELVIGGEKVSMTPVFDENLTSTAQHEYWASNDGVNGNWLAFRVTKGSMTYCRNSDNSCATVIGQSGPMTYINMDEPFDVKDFKNLNVKTDSGFWGCSTAAGRPGSSSVFFIFTLLGFAFFALRRKRKNL